MRQIDIDDDVFQHLESKAIPFVDTTPNLTLRRLLGMNGSVALSMPDPKPPQPHEGLDADQLIAKLKAAPILPTGEKRIRSKQQKADLLTLIRAGMIHQGESLMLVDYQGKKVPGYEAAVANNLLLWQNQHYSMSDLARILLKKVGYTSDSVRGPAHWCNVSGTTIKELWVQYLSGNARR